MEGWKIGRREAIKRNRTDWSKKDLTKPRTSFRITKDWQVYRLTHNVLETVNLCANKNTGV